MAVPSEARKRVLVADDEPHIGRIIKMKLEAGPFDVTLAYDGREASDALAEPGAHFDLVLLDLMMPEMSGLDVLRHLRRGPARETPAIILTAAGQDEQERAATDAGANAFVTKPFSPKKLYALVARLTGTELGDAE
ncbi:MAG: response regulator transcription factor [Gemmatimonadota bacterium]|nr:response regulator transcription factor [Gemmatimonadota bacterium]